MELKLKGTSRVCRGRHGEVDVVEFRLNARHSTNRADWSSALNTDGRWPYSQGDVVVLHSSMLPWRCRCSYFYHAQSRRAEAYAVTSPLPASDVIKCGAHSAGIYEPPGRGGASPNRHDACNLPSPSPSSHSSLSPSPFHLP